MDRIGVEDEDAFGERVAKGRSIVLFYGESCGFSRRFEAAFEERAGQADGWTFLVREVEHGGEGPHGRRHGIEVTPTCVAYADGEEVDRLGGRVGRGIEPDAFEAWLADVAQARETPP